MTNKRFLNLGCGTRFSTMPEWTNADHLPPPGGVFVDLRNPLPFCDASFELVYLSHVLEHFRSDDGRRLIRECVRVLVPGGCLRIVVPDLEDIARHYIGTLEAVRRGDAHVTDLEWATIELIDQLARDFTGGETGRFLQRGEGQRRAARVRGDLEIEGLCRWFEEGAPPEERVLPNSAKASVPLRKKMRYALAKIGERLIGGEGRAYLNVGRFRRGGEVHLSMFDPLSMESLLSSENLVQIIRRDAFTSYCTDWSSFHLDSDKQGRVYKPASLFMEAKRADA